MSTVPNKHDQLIVDYIKEHQNDFYILAYGYVKNRESALDIVQESILKALSSSGRLKDSSSIKTWFYRILVNTSISYIRKNKRIIYFDEVPEIESPVNTHIDINFDLYNAVDQLDTKHKSVIILRYFEDMKIEDIAFILHTNVSTVKSRIYNAIKKLKKIMEGDI
ncbi:RNA polymerase sigma factor [Vallitalea okinawensis]|uniref:RNA polymerase sigma factor n=1 Tax=Vallitalea okinawensis TaxID=2078660 RepID=UPI000CFB104D|nr:sigma-70 family RNA polymerase sigma factor [Vallitalea okinawensis]